MAGSDHFPLAIEDSTSQEIRQNLEFKGVHGVSRCGGNCYPGTRHEVVAVLTAAYLPYIDRWPVSVSLALYNFDTQQFDVSALVSYTGGSLTNNADYPMVANLVYPADDEHVHDGLIHVSYDLVFRDDAGYLSYARAHTLAFLAGNVTTGTPVPEPSTFVLLGFGAILAAYSWRRRRRA